MNKLKNKIKYTLCIAVSIIVTCAVVFLPYLYYYAQDNKVSKTYAVEKFSLEKLNNDTSYNNLQSLLLSRNTIWVNNEESFSDELLNKTVTDSLIELKKSFSENEYASNIIDVFLHDSYIKPAHYESVIVSGAVNSIPVSASLLYVEYYGSNFSQMTILIDQKTNKIYQYDIFGFENQFDIAQNNALSSSDEYDTIFSNIQYNLYEYLNFNQTIHPSITIDYNSFYFYIFNYDYYTLRYDEIVSEYDENIDDFY